MQQAIKTGQEIIDWKLELHYISPLSVFQKNKM